MAESADGNDNAFRQPRHTTVSSCKGPEAAARSDNTNSIGSKSRVATKYRPTVFDVSTLIIKENWISHWLEVRDFQKRLVLFTGSNRYAVLLSLTRLLNFRAFFSVTESAAQNNVSNLSMKCWAKRTFSKSLTYIYRSLPLMGKHFGGRCNFSKHSWEQNHAWWQSWHSTEAGFPQRKHSFVMFCTH